MQGRASIQGLAEGINDPSQEAVPHRGFHHPSAATYTGAGLQVFVTPQQDYPHFVGIDIEGNSLYAVLELEHLLKPHSGQSFNFCNPGTHCADAPAFLHFHARFKILTGARKAGAGLTQPGWDML
jgi:hypothetical protein